MAMRTEQLRLVAKARSTCTAVPVRVRVYPHADRFGIEACALYNGGAGGYDAHAGIAMAPQVFRAE